MGDNNLIIEIIPEDFRNAIGGYHNSPNGCVMDHALRRLFPGKLVSVSATCVVIDYQKEYKIDRKEWGYHENTEEEGSETGLSAEMINQLSAQAKESLEGIPTVKIVLVPWKE